MLTVIVDDPRRTGKHSVAGQLEFRRVVIEIGILRTALTKPLRNTGPETAAAVQDMKATARMRRVPELRVREIYDGH